MASNQLVSIYRKVCVSAKETEDSVFQGSSREAGPKEGLLSIILKLAQCFTVGGEPHPLCGVSTDEGPEYQLSPCQICPLARGAVQALR